MLGLIMTQIWRLLFTGVNACDATTNNKAGWIDAAKVPDRCKICRRVYILLLKKNVHSHVTVVVLTVIPRQMSLSTNCVD